MAVELLCKLDHRECEEALNKTGLALIRGVNPPTQNELLDFCKSFPSYSDKLLEWDFGPVMELKVKADAKNYLFSKEKVPFHWDGAFHKEPAVLAFQCLYSDSGKGGETIFTNTTEVWRSLPPSLQEACRQIELEFSTEKFAHYGGTFRKKLVQKHPLTGETILRFAEPVETKLNPVSRRIHGITCLDANEFVQELTNRIYDPQFCYAHKWQTGDILFADNFTLIHGRNAIQENVERWIRRLQILHKN